MSRVPVHWNLAGRITPFASSAPPIEGVERLLLRHDSFGRMNVLAHWIKGGWLGRNRAFVHRPTPIVPNHPGYALKGREQALAVACRQLRVKQIGPSKSAFSGKSIGAPVIDSDRNLAWVKISGRPVALSDPFFEGELAACGLRGLPKPEILARNERIANGIRWRAIKMARAPSEPAAPTP